MPASEQPPDTDDLPASPARAADGPADLEGAQGWLFAPPAPPAGEEGAEGNGSKASRRLGRGLAALLGEIPQAPAGPGRVIALSNCAEDDDEEDLPDLLPPGAAFGAALGATLGATEPPPATEPAPGPPPVQEILDDPEAILGDPGPYLVDDEVGGLDFPDVELE